MENLKPTLVLKAKRNGISLEDIILNLKDYIDFDIGENKLVYQDLEYEFILNDIQSVDSIEMSINNEIISEEFEIINGGYKLVFKDDRVFYLSYGIAEIVFFISYRNGNQEYLFTKNILVANKEDEKENSLSLYNMIEEIYKEKNYSILVPNFLDNLEEIRLNNKKDNIERKLILIDNIIQNLKINFSYFDKNRNKLTIHNQTLEPFEKARKITDSSIRHIITHPDYLIKSPNKEGILINGEKYIPAKILVDSTKYTVKTYENRTIVAFIWTIYNSLKNIKKYIESFIEDSIKLELNSEIEDGYYLSKNIIDYYLNLKYKSYIEKLNVLEKDAIELYRKYSYLFGKNPKELNRIPQISSTFLEKNHYKSIFNNIIAWFRQGDLYIHKDELFSYFPNADKIYEYYCLITLYNILIELGYNEDIEKRQLFKYNLDFVSCEINNTFYFYKDNIKITLYYQPIIFSDRKENDIDLFRVDKSYYSPDFLLKVDNGQEIKYTILDAKWRNRSKCFVALKELVYKYIYSIVEDRNLESKQKLWILQGKDEENSYTSYMHRHGRLSNTKDEEFKLCSGIIKCIPNNSNKELLDIIRRIIG